MFRLFLTFLIAFLTAVTPSVCLADDSFSCQPSAGTPVHICVGTPPILVDQCTGEIRPNFKVAIARDEQGAARKYYFTYRVLMDHVLPQTPPIDELHSTFALSDVDPLASGPSLMHKIYFDEGHIYQFQINVVVKDVVEVFTATTPAFVPTNQPRSTAVIVGISQYQKGGDDEDSKISNLRHAASDAEVFNKLLREIRPDARITLLKSDVNGQPPQGDSPDLPTKDNIIKALDNANGPKQPLCGPDDWFIFYYSGHGIRSANTGIVTHYLSTYKIDPDNLPEQGIELAVLFSKITSIAARNKAVVLDSCFSGEQLATPKSTKLVRVQGDKALFAKDGKAITQFDVGADEQDVDALSVSELIAKHDRTTTMQLDYLAAADRDQKAQEGIVAVGTDGSMQSFKRAPLETQAEYGMGHGLFTFLLTWSLEHQLPSARNFKELLIGDQTWFKGAACELSLEKAADKTKAILDDYATDIQHPEFRRTSRPTKALVCTEDAQPHN